MKEITDFDVNALSHLHDRRKTNQHRNNTCHSNPSKSILDGPTSYETDLGEDNKIWERSSGEEDFIIEPTNNNSSFDSYDISDNGEEILFVLKESLFEEYDGMTEASVVHLTAVRELGIKIDRERRRMLVRIYDNDR
jgi:hypothetical protein